MISHLSAAQLGWWAGMFKNGFDLHAPEWVGFNPIEE
jgi:hypothetical protein